MKKRTLKMKKMGAFLMQYPVKGRKAAADNGLPSCQPTANTVAMKTHKSDCA